MRLTTVILIASLLQVSASTFGQRITLNQQNISLKTALREITKQSGYGFYYDGKIIGDNQKVVVNVSNAEIDEALKNVLSGLNLTYSIDGKIVSIKRKEQSLVDISDHFDDINVRGRVLDENGKPLPKATIKVKGQATTVLTDDDGKFYIQHIDAKSTIQINYLGYKPVELPANLDLGDIKLDILTSDLKEVGISTGYQKISKERFVGSYSQLDSAAYARRTGMNILDRLDGTVTGVLFDKKASGEEPITIRGISTFSDQTSKAPLIVVDNFPFTGDINSINQNDVENITVLKDAAAAAIWGARAGNGVIVITMKKGRFNQPLRISASSNVNVSSKPDLFYYPQMSTADFIDAERFLFSKGYYDAKLDNTEWPLGWASVTPVVELLGKARANPALQGQVDAQIAELGKHDLRNDLDKYVYRNAVNQQHYLNIGGGTNLLNYTFSAGYNRSVPNIQHARANEQYTLNSNNTFRPAKNLEISAGVQFTQGINHTTDVGLPFNAYPYMQLADANGNSLAVPNVIRQAYIDTVGGGKLLDWNYRPLDEIRNADNTSKTRLLLLNFGLNYRFTPWLSTDLRYQINSTLGSGRNYYNQQSFYARNMINRFTNLGESDLSLRYPVPIGGIIDLSNNVTNTTNARAQLNFNKTWSEKHALTALISGDVSSARSSSDGNRLYGYNDQFGSYKINNNYQLYYPIFNEPYSREQVQNAERLSENNINRLVSLAANVAYTYNNRYSLYASARRDGANVFGTTTNNRWKPLWSAGASWELSKESFFKVSWVDNLKLRGSFGHMGNVAANASGLRTIVYRATPSDLSGLQYAQLRTPENKELRWEQVSVGNIGLDFSLLKSRLSGSVDIFKKKSTDIISNIPFDPSTGISEYLVNSASLKGNGVEVSLFSQNTKGAIRWTSSFGLSYTKTVVTEVYNGRFTASEFIAYGLTPGIGKLAYSISSYKWAGLDPLTGEPRGMLNGQVSKDYAAIFQDSVKNQVYHGSSIPLYSGFLGNSLSYKNFTLSANLTYRLDFYYRKPSISYSTLGINGIGHSDYAARWQKPGDESSTNVPSLIYPFDNNSQAFYQGAEINVLRGDNIRLQDIRLQYAWNNPGKYLRTFKSIQFFGYANNLNVVLWKRDKSNLDPDFSGGNNPGAYPTSKTFALGLNLNF